MVVLNMTMRKMRIGMQRKKRKRKVKWTSGIGRRENWLVVVDVKQPKSNIFCVRLHNLFIHRLNV